MADMSPSEGAQAGNGSLPVVVLDQKKSSVGENLQALKIEVINLRTRLERLEQNLEKERICD
jgi:hypothetical protein